MSRKCRVILNDGPDILGTFHQWAQIMAYCPVTGNEFAYTQALVEGSDGRVDHYDPNQIVFLDGVQK